jgi:hypothetical protein
MQLFLTVPGHEIVWACGVSASLSRHFPSLKVEHADHHAKLVTGMVRRGHELGLRRASVPTEHLGYLPLLGTPLAFLGFAHTPYILTALAVGEPTADQLPRSPGRKVPLQFDTRIVSGGPYGAALRNEVLPHASRRSDVLTFEDMDVLSVLRCIWRRSSV